MRQTVHRFETGVFYNEDTFDAMSKLEDDSVDMLLVDLPYGITACKWDSVLPFDRLWAEYNRVCKENAAMVFTAAQPFTTSLIASNIESFKYSMVWDKKQITNFLNSKRQPLRRTEDVLVFYRRQSTYNPQMKKGKPYTLKTGKPSKNYGAYRRIEMKNEGVRFPDNIINIPQTKVKGGHPTQKPVALFEYLIRTYTNPGDVVLDNTAGSGTTAVAAIQSCRRWVCIEKDKEYFDKACSRVEQAYGDIDPLLA